MDNQFGKFKLYGRVRIKGTKLKGNIVEILDELNCLVELDEFDYDGNKIEDNIINSHIDELECDFEN